MRLPPRTTTISGEMSAGPSFSRTSAGNAEAMLGAGGGGGEGDRPSPHHSREVSNASSISSLANSLQVGAGRAGSPQQHARHGSVSVCDR